MRSEIFDNRTMPVENLATNPSFERAVAGTTVVRKNRALTPVASPTWIGQAGVDGAVVDTFENGLVKTTWVTQPTGGNPRIYSGQTITVTPGETITISLDVAAASGQLTLLMDWLTSGSTWVSLNTSTATTPSNRTDKPSRLSLTATVPAGIALLRVYIRWTSISHANPGNWMAGGRLLVEARPAPALPYFDGSTTDNTGIAYSWENTVNASTSVAKASVTEVRRNLESNPNPATAYGAPAPSTATVTTETTTPPLGTAQYWRVTSDGSSNLLGFDSRISLSVAAGFTGTRSLYVRLSKAATVSVALIGTGASGATLIANPSVAVTANTWTRVYFSATTATVGDFGIRLRTTDTTFVSGDTMDVGAMLTESGSLLGAYFDGNITPDADLTPAWTSTSNGSASTLSGIVVDSATSNSIGYGKNILSWAWAHTGNSSLRTISESQTISDTFVAPGGLVLTQHSMGMRPGKTYTALARLRLSAAQTGTRYVTARQIELVHGMTFGSWTGATYTRSVASANTVGVHELRVTFTVDPSASWSGIRLYSGTSKGNGDAWWDAFMLVEGHYSGPYFDGNMPSCVWRGAPHGSTSAGYPNTT